MKNKKVLIWVFFAVLLVVTIGATNEYYFKIDKSFDIFGSLFKKIAMNYVEEIDPEDLIDNGINGMLNHLDPYTVFYTEKETEDLDIMTSGTYSGIGITVSVRDGMLTVIKVHDGFSAQINGLRRGDRLLKIDSTYILNSTTDNLRKYTYGKVGTTVNLWVLRDGLKDTLFFRLKRQKIQLKNVSYKGFVNDSIGYIKLDRFTRNSAQEVSKALTEFKKTGKLKGLILDLRDNPGGLLGSAVAICELFVPENSIIVSTRGRYKDDNRVYRSIMKPIAPDLPLTVLINGGSASASEIVAGAIQDLDRGIIIGKRSFGKGLVQSIFNLPYNSAVKITTAKYYTPSGRCIQRINYSKKKTLADTNHYHTMHGRNVKESNGILPDTIVKDIESPLLVRELYYRGYYFKFANTFTSNMKDLPKGFKVDKKVMKEFNNFLEKQKFYKETPITQRINNIKELIDDEKFDKSLNKEFDKINKKIIAETKKLLMSDSKEISKYLKREILMRFYTQEKMQGYDLIDDNYVKTAIGLLNVNNYNGILFARKKIKGNN